MSYYDDSEQLELDYQLLQDLKEALRKAIEEADAWHDDSRGGQCQNLDKERNLLKVCIRDFDY